ncbi:IS66 family insertion sequence element accessory protein TnpB [Legionella massiliensis]|uniref:IS66 family insertion sequence element accessory protein TnpB n=1 Tax=Legionella massiliensis TaxID=1034943 RepID=UPI0009E0ABEE
MLDDPFSGTVFVFTNRSRTSVKLLVYDANGFWLCLKRFNRGNLSWWPTGETHSIQIRASELVILLAQGHPIKAGLPDDWRSIA